MDISKISKDGNYRDANPEVMPIIQEFLSEDEFERLDGFRIRPIFRETTAKSGGREVWEKVILLKGRAELLAQVDIVIEISSEVWEALTPEDRRKLVHRALSRLEIVDNVKTGATKLVVRGADVEVTLANMRRYGPWSKEYGELVEVLGAPAPQTKESPVEEEESDPDFDLGEENEVEIEFVSPRAVTPRGTGERQRRGEIRMPIRDLVD